jgi:preprotein translocase subunit SecA
MTDSSSPVVDPYEPRPSFWQRHAEAVAAVVVFGLTALLSRTAKAVGPSDAPAAPQVTTTVTTSGPTSAPAPANDQEIVLPKITVRRDTPKVGRNDPCPCGSGKKYKQCHGA